MIKKILFHMYPNVTFASFVTYNRQEGPDLGCRVKHYIYEDREHPGMYWHERVWLSRTIEYKKPTYTEWVSRRKFWGKVRLVKVRDGCLEETWMATAQAVAKIKELKRIKAKK